MTYPPPEQQPYQPAPQQPQQPPVPVKTGANKVLVIILAIVLVLCLGCGGFGAYWFFQIKNKVDEVVDSIPTDFPTAKDNAAPGNVSHKVRYEVTGTGTVNMVWAEKTVGVGNLEVTLPWTKEFTLNEPNFGAQVIAVPKGASGKPDTCKIFIDGVEKKTAKFVSNSLQCSFVYVSK